jgi:putative transposase
MSMKIAPSERIRQLLEGYLHGGYQQSDQPASEFLKLAAQMVAQEALEQEVTDFLGRERYERQEERVGYRNGYKPGRMRSAEGEIELAVPQVRDSEQPYRSKLMAFFKGNTDVLDYLVLQMYTRGLSTRDVEEAFRDPVTGEPLLGRTAISDITDRLWEDYQRFCVRDLSSFEVEYVFLDAVYESLRRQGNLKEALLCAWAICRDGRKVLLHMALGNKESVPAWRDFIRNMIKRGLPIPTLVATDGAPALIAAVEEIWPKSLRQRCVMHKTRNVLDKVPPAAQAEIKQRLQAIWNAPNRAIADLLLQDFITTYEPRYPSAVACLLDDLEACLVFLRCPALHHKRIRTTNLIERAFAEQRRRTKTIPRFWDERSCLKLVFATLWQTSERWQRVRMTDLELAMLRRLRRELELDPGSPEPTSFQKAAV